MTSVSQNTLANAMSVCAGRQQSTAEITADTTLTTAYNGYIVRVGSLAADSTITLPAVADAVGMSCKLFVTQDNTTTTFDLGIAAQTGEVIKGSIVHTTTGALIQLQEDISFGFTQPNIGSYCDLYCDGEQWLASGVCVGAFQATPS